MREGLRIARIKMRMNQTDVAKAIGVTQQTYSRWEKGYFSPIEITTIHRLEEVLQEKKQVLFPDLYLSPEGAKEHT